MERISLVVLLLAAAPAWASGPAAHKEGSPEKHAKREHAEESKPPKDRERRLLTDDHRKKIQRAVEEAQEDEEAARKPPPTETTTTTVARKAPARPTPSMTPAWLPPRPAPARATARDRAHALLNDELRGRAPRPEDTQPPSELTALEQLIAGNLRFQRTLRPGFEPPAPRAAVLQCTDGPLSAERLFDEPVAAISSVGHVPDAASVAALEHAIRVQGVQLILVLGHDDCTIVERAVAGTLGGSPALDGLVEEMGPKLRALAGLTPTPAVARARVEVHATTAARRLLASSALIRSAVARGVLRVVPVIYSPRSGALTVLEDP